MKGNWRIAIFSCFITFVWVGIAVKLYTLQIKDFTNFQVLANSEQGYADTITTSRGIITTADGVELAINEPSYSVYVYTPNITNTTKFANDILPLLHVSSDTFQADIQSGIKYFQIASNIAPKLKDQLTSMTARVNTNALQFVFTQKRLYPNETFLSQVLGFVNVSNGTGQYGIEGYYDGDLQGIDGKFTGDKDQSGNPIVNQNFAFIPPANGENIALTIDAYLQKDVETKLAKAVNDQQAQMGTVIIMDPKTGDIAAMASYPTFNPNTYYNGYVTDCTNYVFQNQDICKVPNTKWTADQVNQSFLNPAISFTYEPGSVLKAITAAAAINEGKITPDTTVNDATGVYQASGKKIYNYNKEPDGVMNMAEILKKSSNVGASMIAQSVGVSLMYKYYSLFGIGQPTGITLQGEETAQLPDASNWRPIDLATASFGQYVAATPLQVISIYQTLANGGVKMKPQIVQYIQKNGQTTYIKPQPQGQVVSSDTATKVTNMLVHATMGEPAWGLRYMQQYMPIIASKTGTAQIPNVQNTGYVEGQINATYVGYAPASNPRFVLLVMMQNPQAGIYAATTAVPLWASIAQDLFTYYKIAPQ